jgi:hypothetical protein
VVDPLHSALVVAARAPAAGFAQGLTGFAFSIVGAVILGLGAAASDGGAACGFRRTDRPDRVARLGARGLEWGKVIPLVVGGVGSARRSASFFSTTPTHNAFGLAIGVLPAFYSLFGPICHIPVLLSSSLSRRRC